MLWAVLAKSPLPLRLYFAAQLAGTILLELAYKHVSTQTYEALYGICFALVVGTMGDVVWRCVPKKGLIIAAVMSAFILLLIVPSVEVWDADTTLVMAEGFFFSFAGTALAIRVILGSELQKVYATLVILWFTLALFDFAFSIDQHVMERANLWVPTISVLVAMCYMGKKLREYSRTPQSTH